MPMTRPRRIQIRNELGQTRTLASGPDQFGLLSPGMDSDSPLLVLGLGPAPEALADYAQGRNEIFFIESPDFVLQMLESRDDWRSAIPTACRETMPRDLDPALIRRSRIIAYRPIAKLFPSFWGPVLGKIRAALLASAPRPQEKTILLPGSESDLLVPELRHAFKGAGYTVLAWDPGAADSEAAFAALLSGGAPRLFFCVNFRGLDPFGERFHTLRQAGTRVGVWCVDNPWHLVSGLKSPFWKEAALFVTDGSFLPSLRAHGADEAYHLPLAVWPELYRDSAKTQGEALGLENRAVFVGRSAFPGKRGFFSGLKPDPGLMEKAAQMLGQGIRGNFHWWTKQLGISTLWPGTAVRQAGLGAEETGLLLRTRMLEAVAGTFALTVFGDPGWKDILPPNADLRPPVDYYSTLPRIYGQSRYVLNATSPLLPEGLTQRHFDVWAAGGLLVTDATPGLSLFPEELVRPVCFRRPGDIPALLASLEKGPRPDELVRDWQNHILAHHTYTRRVDTISNLLGLG